MIEYRCPNDRSLFFKAEGPVGTVVEVKCGSCKQLVRPTPVSGRVLHRTYECSECGRRQHCERPINDRTYCIICGTASLVIIDEVPARAPVAAPALVTVRG